MFRGEPSQLEPGTRLTLKAIVPVNVFCFGEGGIFALTVYWKIILLGCAFPGPMQTSGIYNLKHPQLYNLNRFLTFICSKRTHTYKGSMLRVNAIIMCIISGFATLVIYCVTPPHHIPIRQSRMSFYVQHFYVFHHRQMLELYVAEQNDNWVGGI